MPAGPAHDLSPSVQTVNDTIMGTPMARHRLDAGPTLHVQTAGRVPDAVAATSAQGVAAGLAGAADGARKVVADMSSISPMASQVLAQKIRALGADSIDARP